MALSLQFYSYMKLRYQLYKARADVKQLQDKLILAEQPATLSEVKVQEPSQDSSSENKEV